MCERVSIVTMLCIVFWFVRKRWRQKLTKRQQQHQRRRNSIAPLQVAWRRCKWYLCTSQSVSVKRRRCACQFVLFSSNLGYSLCTRVPKKHRFLLGILKKTLNSFKMFKIVEPVGNLFKVKHFTTSDTIFKVNTKFTPALLVLFSILLTTMDLLRASIDCYTDTESKRKAIMDNYCWSIGTYICKDHRKGNWSHIGMIWVKSTRGVSVVEHCLYAREVRSFVFEFFHPKLAYEIGNDCKPVNMKKIKKNW